jgi:5-methylcytosine-specific restriction endonuclease McrA
MTTEGSIRTCFRTPIPELDEAARVLGVAVDAHMEGDAATAARLIRQTDRPVIREWLESIWGANSPYVTYREVTGSAPVLSKDERVKARMPSTDEKRRLHRRDGFHCRFCGLPVIRSAVRAKIASVYPDELRWGRTNLTQHAAFQAMWAQYDHVVPHARGGSNDLDNLVVTCAACNFGRMNYLLAEVGLSDPRSREPIRSNWDGLERFAVDPNTSTKTRRRHDQVSIIGPDGVETNASLYDASDDAPLSDEERQKRIRHLMECYGLTEQQAKAIS